MAVEKESRRKHNPVKTSSREARERAAHLAPPEERRDARRDGGPAVDTGDLRLPGGLVEEDEQGSSFFHLEPVAILIIALALAFIAFITYLISTEQAK